MKIRGEILSATGRFEFENLRKVREIFEQRRKPKNTEIHHVVSTYSEQVLAHSSSHSIIFVFSKKSAYYINYINYLQQSWNYLII